MEILKKRILEDGTCYEGGILKVDSFINHQMDPMLMKLIAEEFARRFANDRINKILTIEASGIAPAIMTGYTMQLPVVFAKKKEPKTMRHALSTIVHSFTKDREYPVSISAEYLIPGDRAFGLIDLIRQSGATLAGMGFIIEKTFQHGGDQLREMGIHVESLARIKSLENCQIIIE